MKKFLVIVNLLTASVATGSQISAKPTEIVEWGARAAVDLNLPGKWRGDAGSVTMYRPGWGATLGAVCNVWLGRNFFIEPGISVFYDTYSYKDLIITDETGSTVESDPSLYKVGLRIPVVAGYTFVFSDRFAMSFYTGPELSYAFAGKTRVKHKELIGGTDLELFGDDGAQRRVDCAWKVGVGFPIDDWTISFATAIGMTDLMKTGVSFRENRCTLSLSRYF